MKQYEKYKDSGVEWLGEIPEHWKQSKLKHEFYIKARVGWKGLKSDEFQQNSYAYLVTGTDFRDVEINWKNCYQIDEVRYNDDPFIQLMNGDLLITKDGTIGKTSFVRNLDKPACLNSGIFVLRQIKDTTVDFFYWLLNSSIFHDFNKMTVSGSTIQHLYQNIFENFIFSVPEKVEQQAINLYLNHTTSAIDLLIKEKESLITKLQEKRKALINEVVTKGLNPNAPMRDSGIEWLGMIPKHWEINRVKSIVALINEKGSNSGSKKVGLENIESKTGRFLDSNSVFEGEGVEFVIDDILFGKLRPYLAKVYLSEFCGQAVGDFYVLRSRDCVLPKYLACLLISDLFISLVDGSTYGAKMPRANWEFISNIQVAIPSLEEQNLIVNYIDSRTLKIGQTISELQIQIQKLKEYKTAVISEVVTGKVDVREWKPKNN